jgi:hypothetical protein
MPMAQIGPRTAIWITENGYPSSPAPRSESSQAAAVSATVQALCQHGAYFGVTDYRYFNVRDNNSTGAGLFSADGLLRDDNTRKPAYAALRGLIARCSRPLVATGRAAAAQANAGSRASHRRSTARRTGRLAATGGVRLTAVAGAVLLLLAGGIRSRPARPTTATR